LNRKPKYSFYEWCIDNNRKDLLDRWDYDKNDFSPKDIAAKTEKLIWMKCPEGIHDSELHRIDALAYGKANNIHCDKCDSFAQYIIDNYGSEYLDSIWSDKNDKTPWEYSRACNKNVWFRCLDNPEHHYQRFIGTYIDTQNCPICEKLSHSIGIVKPKSVELWSDLNETTPYDHSSCCQDIVYWKCENGIHDDYKINIKSASDNDFTCPKCRPKKWFPKIGLRADLVGKDFGELHVDGFHSIINNSTYWDCTCSCGRHVVMYGYGMTRGSIKTCGDKSFHFRGDKNPNWKDDATRKNYSDRYSPEYKKWHSDVLAKDMYTCQCCGQYSGDLEAHHIYDFATHEELRTVSENGITLCKSCHNPIVNGSFHNVYGTIGKTPEELEKYINNKRDSLDINIPFSLESYLAGNILKPGDVFNENVPWIFDVINNKNVKLESNRPKIVA